MNVTELVYVHSYVRCRNGKWESVDFHYRHWPRSR